MLGQDRMRAENPRRVRVGVIQFDRDERVTELVPQKVESLCRRTPITAEVFDRRLAVGSGPDQATLRRWAFGDGLAVPTG